MSAASRQLLSLSSEILLMIERDTLTIIDANPGALALLGYSQDELIGRAITDIDVGLGDMMLWEEVRCGHESEVHNVDSEFMCADGSMLAATKSILPILDAPTFLGLRADAATLRKRAENDLAQLGSRLRATLEATGDGIALVDREGALLNMNRRFATLWGIPQELLNGMDDQAIFSWIAEQTIDKEGFISRTQQMNPSSEQDFTGNVRLRNGRIFEYSSHPAYQGSEVIGRVFTQSDITERKRVEARLSLLSLAVESSPISVTVTDANRTIEYANRRACEQTGYSVEEQVGRPIEMHVGTLDLGDIVEEIRAQTEANQAWRGDICLPRKDGEMYWVNLAVSPMTNDDGEITHYVYIAEEITHRIRQEVELRAAKDEAENAAQAKSDFLANMSHEIRTPMNAVIGLTRLCLNTDLTDKQRDYLLKVSGAAKSLLGIINDILDFSKIEAGRMGIECAPFRLAELLFNSINMVQTRANEKSLTLTSDVPQNLQQVLLGDPVRIGQILTNLLTNAVKFTERGSVSTNCSIEHQQGDDILLRISVFDTGIGITDEQMALLFQPFAQADMSTTRRFGGTGLGLSISKRLVEMMGGRVWAESINGQGTVFHFTVRVHYANEVDAAALESGQGAQIVTADEMRGLKVLLVEDNLLNQQATSELLADEGMLVTIACNGSVAVDLLDSSEFDIVLMDMQMPVMDGLEATRTIRRNPRWKDLPIIAMTANAMTGDRERCIAAGMNDYVAKPVDPDALFAAMATVASKAPRELPSTQLDLLDGTPMESSHEMSHNEPAQLAGDKAMQESGLIPFVDAPLNVPLFDIDSAIARLRNKRESWRKLLVAFEQQLMPLMHELDQALECGDLVTAGRHAHTLKGSSGIVGADRLRAACAETERSCKATDASAAQSSFVAIIAVGEITSEEIGRLVDEG